MTSPRFGRYRHFLGAWDPSASVRTRGARVDEDGALVASGPWRALSEPELAGATTADVIADTATLTRDGARGVAVMTVPAWVRRDLWGIDWSETGASITPADAAAFAEYCRRVGEFFRSTGVAIAEKCEAQLVASAAEVDAIAYRLPRTAMAARSTGFVVLTNVGEQGLHIAFGSARDDPNAAEASIIALTLEPSHACIVPRELGTPHVTASVDAEFGLHLQLHD